jgi:DNA-directed RNA polymerase sigma subunit (sigma70/sigma32)
MTFNSVGVQVRAMKRAESELAARGREPTDKDLADVLGLPAEAIPELRRIAEPVASLDKLVDEKEKTPLSTFYAAEGVAPAEEVLDDERNSEVAAALASLPAKTQRVLELRFGLGRAQGKEHSLGETARKLKLTRTEARKREHDGLRALERVAAALAPERALVGGA